MLTRIISGAVLILVVGGILVLGNFYPPVLAAFIAIISSIACYEILNNTGIIKKRAATYGACVYALICAFAHLGYTEKLWGGLNSSFFTVLYVVYIAFVALKYNKEFGLSCIGASVAFPVIISYAFSCIASLYAKESGVFYLLLLLNFSSVCDTGAYFTGVLLGKHKLCPNISPKKTVEGAVGGIVWSLICTTVLCFVFKKVQILAIMLIATVPFCIVGMCGDLFASVIKRSVDLKDYGKLIPGHGGILDRFDSILLIAPVLSLFVQGGLF
ncbi:MAG: phosphatidate cytidylyltransferase [Clostridia bacterium]|nr:phosphatidate cytidylyltransferase [Clostridia bacterium]